MSHTLVDLIDSRVVASDGTVGRVVDAYVDDRTWEIRYFVVAVAQSDGDEEMVCFPETITEVDDDEGSIAADRLFPRHCAPTGPHGDVRSSRDVLGCAVSGMDGPIGCTEDAIIETDSWSVLFLLIDCRGVLVLLQPTLIDEAQWEEDSLQISHVRTMVLSSDSEDTIELAPPADFRRLH